MLFHESSLFFCMQEAKIINMVPLIAIKLSNYFYVLHSLLYAHCFWALSHLSLSNNGTDQKMLSQAGFFIYIYIHLYIPSLLYCCFTFHYRAEVHWWLCSMWSSNSIFFLTELPFTHIFPLLNTSTRLHFFCCLKNFSSLDSVVLRLLYTPKQDWDDYKHIILSEIF